MYLIFFPAKCHVECRQNHVWGPLGARDMTNFVKHVFFAKVGKVGESDRLSSDPLSSDPLSSDPLGSDPLSSDPLSSDPLSSDIETILLRAGTKRVHKYKSGTKAVQKVTKALQKRYKRYKDSTTTVQKSTKAIQKQYKKVQKRYKNGTQTVQKKCSKRPARLPLKST